jgi:hypothetical protein
MTELRPGETRPPNPGIEAALAAAMAGTLGMGDFLKLFAEAGVILVSATDFSGEAGVFQPLVFTRDDVAQLAVFTARDRAEAWASKAPFSTTMLGRRVFEALQPGVGLVVNPGSGLGFEMAPGGIPTILAELASVAELELPDPEVRLEQAILDAQSGHVDPETLLAIFGGSRVYVLSHTDDGLTPITFQRDGGPTIVGVFTRPDHAQQFTEGVEFALHVNAGWLAANLAEGVGIVVNPGTGTPWELAAEVVASVPSTDD